MHGIQLKWNLKPSHLVLRFLWEIHSIHSNSLNTFTRSRVWKHFTNSIEQTKQGQLHTTETLERISKIKKEQIWVQTFLLALAKEETNKTTWKHPPPLATTSLILAARPLTSLTWGKSEAFCHLSVQLNTSDGAFILKGCIRSYI